MNIQIIGKHLDVTDAMKTKIEEKISKLPKYYNSLDDVEVIVEGNEGGASSSVEVIARAKHNRVFVAKQAGVDMYVCLDEVVKKIERQLTKHKQKERDNKHTGVTTEQ
ncbi:MAG: ribosome-associated translation inhibitor RaiA [Sedimentisphaerales bacterium]|nr:ribosome-associated translation inhibitor RaiA [Sedimentisphaerales bacterium]